MKTLTALATLAALGVATAAAAEIRIGATVSETGPAAFLGDPEAKTLRDARRQAERRRRHQRRGDRR